MSTTMTRDLVERARSFRREPTRSEAILWELLRGRSCGVRFYRQELVGPFVPDFVCKRPKLVVEIDGPVHETQRDRDLERQRWLEARGYVVLRFSAEQVGADSAAVMARIQATLSELRGT